MYVVVVVLLCNLSLAWNFKYFFISIFVCFSFVFVWNFKFWFFFLSGGGVWFSFWTRDQFHWRTQPDGKIYNSNTDGQRLEMSLKLLAGFHFTRSTLFTRNRMCVHPVAVYTQTFCCAVSRVVVVFFFYYYYSYWLNDARDFSSGEAVST